MLISVIGHDDKENCFMAEILLPEAQEPVLIRTACAHKFLLLFSSFIFNDVFDGVRVRSILRKVSNANWQQAMATAKLPIDIIIAFANDGKSQKRARHTHTQRERASESE